MTEYEPRYIAAALRCLENTEGTHPVSETQAYALLSIAYSLVSIAHDLREIDRQCLVYRAEEEKNRARSKQ